MHHLVIGGSKGIGRRLAEELRERGDTVITLSRTPPPDNGASWFPCDLSSKLGMDTVLKAMWVRKLEFDTVTFCAALQDRKATQWSWCNLARHVDVNFLGPVYLYCGLENFKLLKSRPTVLFFGSKAGEDGSSWAPAYASSKIAMWTWLKSKYLSQSEDIRMCVNQIFPGRVNTPGNPKRVLSKDDPVQFVEPMEIMPEVLKLLLLKAPCDINLTTVDLGLRK